MNFGHKAKEYKFYHDEIQKPNTSLLNLQNRLICYHRKNKYTTYRHKMYLNSNEMHGFTQNAKKTIKIQPITNCVVFWNLLLAIYLPICYVCKCADKIVYTDL